jgi:hypothetical protein
VLEYRRGAPRRDAAVRFRLFRAVAGAAAHKIEQAERLPSFRR